MSIQAELQDEKTYCAVHPDRETGLRCNKCGRLMCVECAVQTPVGYRCRECVRGHEDKFFKAQSSDLALTFAIPAGLAAVAGFIAGAVSAPLLFVIILGLPVGGAIAEAALRATGRRRGRQSPQLATVGAALGGLLGAFIQSYTLISGLAAEASARAGGEAVPVPLDFVFSRVFNDIGLLIWIVLIAAAVYGRYRM